MHVSPANAPCGVPDPERTPALSQHQADQIKDIPSKPLDVNPMGTLEQYRSLAPATLGLACSSAVVSISAQMAHRTTGIAEYGGAPALLAVAVFGCLFLSTLRIKRFGKQFISVGTFLAIHLAGLCSLLLGLVTLQGTSIPVNAFILLEGCVLVGSTFLEFYWLRKLRGTAAQAVAATAFCAIALSELITYALSFCDPFVWRMAAMFLTFAQFAGIRMSRALEVPSDLFPAVSESYFGTDEHRFSNRSFLVVAATGIWLISIPMGMGRGFSSGDALFMSTVPRFMVLALTCIVAALWVRHALASHMRKLTTSIWIVMEVLLALGAIFFTVWPNTPGIGAAFVMTSSLVLTAFVWYLTIAFISFGWRDPFYYACAAWIAVNLLCVGGMRLDALITQLIPDNTAVIVSVMSLFILVSAQVVFTQLLFAPSEHAERQAAQGHDKAMTGTGTSGANNADLSAEDGANNSESQSTSGRHVTQDDVRRIHLMGVMALSPHAEAPMASATPDAHIATSVLRMGQRFGLTGREIEVLTLYALGHTQARVSEELQLSPNTVHTHIKRIYDKTDMHSRQEILDYIGEYERN